MRPDGATTIRLLRRHLEDAVSQPGPPIEHVDPATGAQLVAGGALLLDVRTAEEFAAGHAPGAVNVPLAELAARQAELPFDRTIVVVCRSGGRSTTATEALVGAGHRAVNLAGGMQAWTGDARPCVTDDGRPGEVA
jgi:rhodanese-related sulfurtransferase